jgi:hypothetical protein
MSRRFKLLGLLITLTMSLILPPISDAHISFSLPKVGQIGTWEAERAKTEGSWDLIRHPSASGGMYLKPKEIGEKTELIFPIEIHRPVDLRIWALLWRHSDRRPARHFPYPLEHRPGPDVIDWWKTGRKRILLFTSPETGRVAALDPQSEKVIGTADLGGYIADLIVDRNRNMIYLANSTEDRVQILNPTDLSHVAEIRIEGAPWSLALEGDNLYVGCLKGRKIVRIDLVSRSVSAAAEAPWEVAHIELLGKEDRRAVAWLEPIVIDMESFKRVENDREQYGFGRKTVAEVGRWNRPGWIRFTSPSHHLLKLEAVTGKDRISKEIDVRSVTEAPEVSDMFPTPLKETPGPDAMVMLAGKLFFTSPSTGRIGVVDAGSGELIRTIDVGGYLSDIASDPTVGKLFVSDALGDRVVVIDPAKLEIEGEVAVPDMPVALEAFIPPGWLKGCRSSLLVACYEARKVVRVDPDKLEITGEVDLPAEPLLLKVVTSPNNSWWPLIPSDRIALELRTRLAVFLSPMAFDPETLQRIGSADVSPRFYRRSSVSFELGNGISKRFRADNAHTVEASLIDREGRAVEERWIDVSSVTDPQLAPPMPLSRYDRPGPLTISLDDGPEYPWRREIWMTPDQMQFLVAETREFWCWNSPVLHLEPGRHTIRVKAYSPFLQIDAIKVERSPEGSIRMKVVGEPPHAEAIPERYRSLFYHDEPVRFKLELENLLGEPQGINIHYEARNYMNEVEAIGSMELTLMPKEVRSERINLELENTGTFALLLTLRSPQGEMIREHRFVRVPKLEHPRMLFRREDIPQIKARIAEHPRLFERYFEWLRRQCEREGFLPAGIARSSFVPKLPEKQRKLPQNGAWRRYDLGWRMLAVQFGAMFADDREMRDYFRSKIRQILKDARTDYYCIFHHHGPFFPGAVAALFDLVAATSGEADDEVEKLREFFNGYLGDMNVFPWTLASIEEPLTVRERALLWHIGMWLANIDRYFTLHQGKRGGRRWINERTACHCPYAGYGYSFLYLRNLFGERRFHGKKLIYGFLTHSELVRPVNDRRRMFGPVGPLGEPMRWIDNVLSKHPLEGRRYAWEKLIRGLEKGEISEEEVDGLLEFKESASTTKPMAFVVPIALALGWYDPEAPEVELGELPPTLFFEGEGDVVMRSDWGPTATEVIFRCGLRDHVYRHQPTHLLIVKRGEFLLGTASSYGDDGNPNPGKTWGNVVVVEPSDWRRRWGENLRHPRAEEYCLINRFSDPTFRYISREERLVRYKPAERGWGGGLDLHGHTESLLLKEGEIIAYETWPEFDYVAGDATNSWDLGLAEEAYRQVVFVKPDIVVVYDRVSLGPGAERGYWVAATGPELEVKGNRFVVRSGSEAMHGWVMLPEDPKLETYDPSKRNKYTIPPPFSISYSWRLFDGRTRHQKVLEIHPTHLGRKLEYLILMRIGGGEVEVKTDVDDRYAGISLLSDGRWINIRFRREGPVGGDITLIGGKLIEHEFTNQVEDDYHHWSDDPRFEMWMTDLRFRFLNMM